MAKAIKWQIPFASLSGTLYRIDIYAEGYSGDPIQLTAGETPFVTDEDSSEDFFAPIRTQTGSIQVCTRKPDGTMLTLDEILPANNIDHPVRLINLSNSNAIEWQGFLSCEAYSQNYTSIPENLTLSVISVLEAMDSVDVPQSTISGVVQINKIIYNLIKALDDKSGVTSFTHVNYSQSSWRIFNKYIDTSTFYSESENSDNNTDVLVTTSISVKEALTRFATYMGLVVRERGTEIYFQRLMEKWGMLRETIDHFKDYFHVFPNINTRNLQVDDLADQIWMGTGHEISLRSGAKKVGVVAKLEDFDFGLKLPKFPEGDTTDVIHVGHQSAPHYDTIFNKNTNAYPNISFKYTKYGISWASDYSSFSSYFNGATTITPAMNSSELGGGLQEGYPTSGNVGAFFVNTAINQAGQNDAEFKQGLYCTFRPTQGNSLTNMDNFIFRILTTKKYSFRPGRIKIKLNFSYFWGTAYNGGGGRFEGSTGEFTKWFSWSFRVGGTYYDSNNSTWVNSRTINTSLQYGQILEIDCDTNSYMSGICVFELHATTVAASSKCLIEALIDSIEVTYEPTDGKITNDRSENNFSQILSANFRDEIHIDTEYASYMNNKTSPSFIMETTDTPMETLDYTVTAEPDLKRPESELLSRLALYYHKKRRTLSLIVKPTDMPYEHALPIEVFNGLDTDTRQYVPLVESRDWREETSTIECFEVPASDESVNQGGGIIYLQELQ